MSDPDRLAATEVTWCPNCGAIGPPDAVWLAHPRGCMQPSLERTDRMAVVRWRRERKRDGWYAEDIDWLIARVEALERDLTIAYRSIHRLSEKLEG